MNSLRYIWKTTHSSLIFVNHIFQYLIQLNLFPFKMIKVNALHAVPYLLVFFDLCLVNSQHPDGMIKLKQGNIIGVRNYSSFLIYCVSLIYSVNCAFLVESISRNFWASLCFSGHSICTATNWTIEICGMYDFVTE